MDQVPRIDPNATSPVSRQSFLGLGLGVALHKVCMCVCMCSATAEVATTDVHGVLGETIYRVFV